MGAHGVEERFKTEAFNVAYKEYIWIEDQIDRFDERSLKIKAWSITLSGVALGAGFNYDKPKLFLVASVSALVFWYLEASWKYFQEALTDRVCYLEEYLNGRVDDYTGPGICKAFRDHFKWSVEAEKFPKIFRLRNVNLPHSVVFVSGLILYLRSQGGFL
jgi:hypothetical protein